MSDVPALVEQLRISLDERLQLTGARFRVIATGHVFTIRGVNGDSVIVIEEEPAYRDSIIPLSLFEAARTSGALIGLGPSRRMQRLLTLAHQRGS